MAGRLLIIDDDVDFAESIADLLEGQGYETALAHSAREGLERIAAADFDLVLLDMKMPGMSGVACLEELHRLRPGLPALMVTAFTRTELLRQALAAGAVAVLGKPVSVDDLFSVVSTVTAPASVLLVEDDQDLAAELCEALAGRGYEVRCAGTLAEARATLSARPAKLLLLDDRLPDGDGGELVRWLKAEERSEAVVIVTACPDVARAQLPCVSIQDVVVKPFTPGELFDAIDRRLAEGLSRRPSA